MRYLHTLAKFATLLAKRSYSGPLLQAGFLGKPSDRLRRAPCDARPIELCEPYDSSRISSLGKFKLQVSDQGVCRFQDD
jgi:hypothetical protein